MDLNYHCLPMGIRYWLMKCEPAAYTIDDLERDGRTSWEGVRNYMARNFMRDGHARRQRPNTTSS